MQHHVRDYDPGLVGSWYYVNWQSSLIDAATWLHHAGCAAVTETCLTAGECLRAVFEVAESASIGCNVTGGLSKLIGVVVGPNPIVVAGGEGYFCNDISGGGGCTYDRRSKAYCNFKDHNSPLPLQNQVRPQIATSLQHDC